MNKRDKVLLPVAAVALVLGGYMIYQFEFVQLPAMKECVAKAQAFQGNTTVMIGDAAAHDIFNACMSAKGLSSGY